MFFYQLHIIFYKTYSTKVLVFKGTFYEYLNVELKAEVFSFFNIYIYISFPGERGGAELNDIRPKQTKIWHAR